MPKLADQLDEVLAVARRHDVSKLKVTGSHGTDWAGLVLEVELVPHYGDDGHKVDVTGPASEPPKWETDG